MYVHIFHIYILLGSAGESSDGARETVACSPFELELATDALFRNLSEPCGIFM